ncbi:MAG: DUF2911 domain-containing protein [Microscillaceae bacterium]|nr:DUF2911 domain-containing protein [Microscillaceae bacterium]
MDKRIVSTFKYVFVSLLIFGVGAAYAQKSITPPKKASPLAMATFIGKDNTYLKVTYGQPYKKSRVIFGELVPFGEIWRTGANEATEFTCTDDIQFNKKILKAGTYTLFTIPGEKEWSVILNSELGQYGAYKYEEIKDKNILIAPVEVDQTEDIYEAFTIEFEETKKGANMLLFWDQTKVIIPITFAKSN